MNRREFLALGVAAALPLPVAAPDRDEVTSRLADQASETIDLITGRHHLVQAAYARTADELAQWMHSRFRVIGQSNKAYEEWAGDAAGKRSPVRAVHRVFSWGHVGHQDREADLVRAAVDFLTKAAPLNARMIWRRLPTFSAGETREWEKDLPELYCRLSLRCWIEGIDVSSMTPDVFCSHYQEV